MDTKTPYKKPDKELDAVKMPPHSVEAEQAVIGGLMLDNDSWDHVVERLHERDFYRYEHRLIFRAIGLLVERNQPFDVITISDALKGIDELENIGGEIYLFELSRNTPTASNIKAYADIVRERSVLRQMIGVAAEIADSAYHPEGVATAELLDQAERRVFEIADQSMRSKGPQAVKLLVAQAMERIDQLFHSKNAITGLSTGYIDLDRMTSGLQQSDLIIVAGRPSMGKTTFAMNIAENAAIRESKPVLVFSMEMPGDSLAMRMLSSLSRVDQHRVRTGGLKDEDWSRIGSSVNILSQTKMFIDDTPALTPSELRSKARRVARDQGGLGLIVIDYLQLMRTQNSSENRTAEISEISRSLKALAKELNVPVIALSQLNRSLEQRADRRPMMSDLRESGAIEQDADLIVFIYRDEVYHPETQDKGIAEIIIAKQRNGPIGKARLNFHGQYTRFDNLAEGQQYTGGLD
jgi:replicative DNA helicase